jgi:hypothetical protein
MILLLCKNRQIFEPCSLNIAITDGRHILASRFRNGTTEPPSLYFNFGHNFHCESGSFKRSCRKSAKELLIASSPLTKDSCDHLDKSPEHEHSSDISPCFAGDWILIPKNHMLIGKGDLSDLETVERVDIMPITVSTELLANVLTPIKSHSLTSAIEAMACSDVAIYDEAETMLSVGVAESSVYKLNDLASSLDNQDVTPN